MGGSIGTTKGGPVDMLTRDDDTIFTCNQCKKQVQIAVFDGPYRTVEIELPKPRKRRFVALRSNLNAWARWMKNDWRYLSVCAGITGLTLLSGFSHPVRTVIVGLVAATIGLSIVSLILYGLGYATLRFVVRDDRELDGVEARVMTGVLGLCSFLVLGMFVPLIAYGIWALGNAIIH